MKKPAKKATPKAKRKGKLVVWKGKDRKWYWHIASSNGKIMADGNQGYERKEFVFQTLTSLGSMLRDVRLHYIEAKEA